MSQFPHYAQPDQKDCGPTSLKIIAKFHGKTVALANIRKLSETTRSGSSLLSLSEAAEHMGFRSTGLRLSFNELLGASLPCIVQKLRLQVNFLNCCYANWTALWTTTCL